MIREHRKGMRDDACALEGTNQDAEDQEVEELPRPEQEATLNTATTDFDQGVRRYVA